ncbi:helix-turn-helix domain-containing protein [Rhizobium rhizogenes]|uniref:ATP-binding protein n=1 Tax=Rhizobium rhizogenes TaxID=359 RepID=A0A546XGU1_RHIRH|nr:ATP-binding protein [Rhizobium rhizogenes]
METSEIIKDAVAFHNAFGGYIVFGVADKGKSRLRGVDNDFNCADFNNRLNSVIADNSVECDFKVFPLSKLEAQLTRLAKS